MLDARHELQFMGGFCTGIRTIAAGKLLTNAVSGDFDAVRAVLAVPASAVISVRDSIVLSMVSVGGSRTRPAARDASENRGRACSQCRAVSLIGYRVV